MEVETRAGVLQVLKFYELVVLVVLHLNQDEIIGRVLNLKEASQLSIQRVIRFYEDDAAVRTRLRRIAPKLTPPRSLSPP